jgi:hypothetical protein
MHNGGITGCGSNCEADRDAHDRTLPRTGQGFHLFERLLRLRLWGGSFLRLLSQGDSDCKKKDQQGR